MLASLNLGALEIYSRDDIMGYCRSMGLCRNQCGLIERSSLVIMDKTT
jgi:hypothetical protein